MTVSASIVHVRPIFFDLECNGIPEKGKLPPSITELAAFDPTKGRRFSAFLQPEQHYQVKKKKEEKSEQITETFSAVWPRFKKWCEEDSTATTRIVLIAHNAWEHDQVILKAECDRIGNSIPREWKVFDTAALAKTMKLYPSPALKTLREHYKIPLNVNPHVAMNDTDMLYEVFLKMTASAENREKVYEAMLDPHPVKAVISLLKTESVALPILNRPIVPIYYDTETTGLLSNDPNAPKPRVVELAAFTPTRKGNYAKFSYLVNPEMPIPKEASDVHKITDAMVKDELKFKFVWRRFLTWMQENAEEDCRFVLIAHNNYNYDKKVLEAEIDRCGLPNMPKDWRWFDTFFLANSVMAGEKEPGPDGKPKAVSKKLEALARRYNCVPKEFHRAMGDVEAMYGVMSHWIGKTPSNKIYEAMFTPNPIVAVATMIKEAKLAPQENEEMEEIEPIAIPAAAEKPGEDTEPDEELIIVADRIATGPGSRKTRLVIED